MLYFISLKIQALSIFFYFPQKAECVRIFGLLDLKFWDFRLVLDKPYVGGLSL